MLPHGSRRRYAEQMATANVARPRPRKLVGRESSHFTRVTRIFAEELGIQLTFSPVYDLKSTESSTFGGNPARKVPALIEGDGDATEILVGTENICRRLAELSTRKVRIVWPEELGTTVSRNAQELVWHAMAAQVQLAFGTMVNELPADNLFFVKGRAGFEGSLAWLDEHLTPTLAALPKGRDLSLFEVTLFCLLEHLPFRGTLSTQPYLRLRAFAAEFAQRESAKRTPYRFDVAPGA